MEQGDCSVNFQGSSFKVYIINRYFSPFLKGRIKEGFYQSTLNPSFGKGGEDKILIQTYFPSGGINTISSFSNVLRILLCAKRFFTTIWSSIRIPNFFG